MLAYPMAEQAAYYRGTDMSAPVIAGLQAGLAAAGAQKVG